MNTVRRLLPRVKDNLILEHNRDDALIQGFIRAAIAYAESYQHLPVGYYTDPGADKTMPLPRRLSATTEQAIIMLSSHLYESRDGSTAGFFGDNVQAGQRVWDTVNLLLRLDRRWIT